MCCYRPLPGTARRRRLQGGEAEVPSPEQHRPRARKHHVSSSSQKTGPLGQEGGRAGVPLWEARGVVGVWFRGVGNCGPSEPAEQAFSGLPRHPQMTGLSWDEGRGSGNSETTGCQCMWWVGARRQVALPVCGRGAGSPTGFSAGGPGGRHPWAQRDDGMVVLRFLLKFPFFFPFCF